MKLAIVIAALLLVSSLSGCISAKVDAKDASKEWAEVGKEWAKAFQEPEQGEAVKGD